MSANYYILHIHFYITNIQIDLTARENEVKEVKTGLYSRVELTGEELDQHIDSLKSVEWTKRNRSVTCLCCKKNSTFNASFSNCCGTAHFYLNNNTLILENVTAQDEGVFKETIVLINGTIKLLNFTLIIQCKSDIELLLFMYNSSDCSVAH